LVYIPAIIIDKAKPLGYLLRRDTYQKIYNIIGRKETMAMPQKEFEEFKAKAFKFIWEELAPLEDEIENTGRIPREKIWPRIREIGMFGMMIPKEYGGKDLSHVQYAEFEKEWSKCHGGLRVLFHVGVAAGGRLHGYQLSDKEKRDWYSKMLAGELCISTGITEPGSGSGRDTKTTATPKDSNYTINGEKHLITNADFAQIINVLCRIQLPSGGYTFGSIWVERDRPGLIIREMKPCMGCRGAYHARLIFRDCVVPASHLIGREGEDAVRRTVYGLNVSRINIAATALGTMERCLDLCLEYVKKRVTFGKPIAERQAVQRYLVEMAMDIYALDNVIKDAAKKVDEGKDVWLEANLCKYLAFEAGRRVTDNALLVFGGIGYTREYPIERLYRDLRLNWLEEGTPSIQVTEAARRLFAGSKTYKSFHKEEVPSSLELALRGL
jgi:alkylation response protein AidB-like acyl-CoA dehydrogenase